MTIEAEFLGLGQNVPALSGNNISVERVTES